MTLAPALLDRRMHGARSRRRGASLIEVLTATAIMGIVLGIGVPNLVRLRAPYASANAARQVAADLQAARLRAIARNTQVRVRFTNNSATYVIERNQAGSWVADSGLMRLPDGASVGTVSPNNPVFDSRGMLPAAVTVPVGATHANTHTVAINVLGHTTIN